MTILHRIARLPATPWTAVAGTLNLLFVAISGLLIARAKDGVWYLAVLIPLAFAYYFCWYGVSKVRSAVFPHHPDLVVKMIRELSEWRRHALQKLADPNADTSELMAESRSLLRRIRTVVESSHDLRGFGTSDSQGLEVCLMSESLDDALVRADGTRPVNCIMCAVKEPITRTRFRSRPDIYDKTEAAKLYGALSRGDEPDLVVVADTNDAKYDFAHIDSGAARIGSMVIAPLRRPLASGQRPLIVACLALSSTKPKFFIEADQAFWRDFVDLVGPDLVFLLERVELASAGTTSAPVPW